MGDHRIVPHTADAVLEGEGASFAAATTALLAALRELAFDRPVEAPVDRWQPFEPAPAPLPMPLVEIVDEASWRLEGGELPMVWEGDAEGGRLGLGPWPEGLEPVREVKAVTFHDAEAAADPAGRWRCRVTVDL